MRGKTIAVLYFYLLSAVATGLIVTGVFSIVNYTVNVTQYDKYPLLPYQSADCDNLYQPVPIATEATKTKPIELTQQKATCEKRIEDMRRDKKINDFKDALTFPAIGLILFLIHFPQARRLSKDNEK